MTQNNILTNCYLTIELRHSIPENCSKVLFYVIIVVSDNQPSQENRVINKSASSPFIATSKPYNKLAWTPELGAQTKHKQEEVSNSRFTFLRLN